jgi:hypothetical protein
VLQLNATVSIPAFLARASLLMAVAAVIGQSKWLWFKVTRRLAVLQSFEDASRGPLGALKFMAGHHKR